MVGRSKAGESASTAELRFGEFLQLTTEAREFLANLFGPPQSLARQHVLRHDGDPPTHLYLLVEGWVSASLAVTSGKQQTVKIHLPGDVLGAPSLPVARAAEALTALTPVVVRSVSRADFMTAVARCPRFAVSVFLSAQKERLALMSTLALVGQTEGGSRIAGMLIDLYDRLTVLGRTEGGHMPLPLTQHQIGELVGLSPVHVNRKIREFEQAGLILRETRTVQLLDIDKLREMAGLTAHEYLRDPEWISLP
ncbi:Crp/Fnr family transcriptional regulator [Brevundimonas sp. NIBR11]|uniref:Crp/Fnr family transcriptional regulator n=1 Tax=Brevundimonas sp. NIBR11 TaxID=3015999 RepID=UPI0022F1193D|nr:Crp/Fnr family transcriptional regulator [Brevundimonas sp. NIBR11]WGM30489.1 hypothetical protein KKHFBJBL_00713 [Brevundimonas sp. NIBR11]